MKVFSRYSGKSSIGVSNAKSGKISDEIYRGTSEAINGRFSGVLGGSLEYLVKEPVSILSEGNP